MKIYCVLFDTMPFNQDISDFISSNKAELLWQVGGCFTLSTLVEMFTGKIPSDLEQNGIGWHRYRRYLDPATGIAHWPWREQVLAAHLLKSGWEVRVHNGKLFTTHVYEDDAVVGTYGRPGEVLKEKKATLDDDPLLFDGGPQGRAYQESETAFIRGIQAVRTDKNIFHIILYHHYHAAVAHDGNRTVAMENLLELMSKWDLNEPQSLFWFFSDHGDWTAIGEHPLPRDYMGWVAFKNNRKDARPVQAKFIAAADFFATVMELCGTPLPDGEARSLYQRREKDRLFFTEDGRARFDLENSTTALAIRFTNWKDGMPGAILQTSFFQPKGEFQAFRTNLDADGCPTASERISPAPEDLKRALAAKFEWVVYSDEREKADALTSLGVLFANAGRHAEALDYFRRAVIVCPRHYGAIRHLLVLLIIKGRAADAFATLKGLLEKTPDDAEIHSIAQECIAAAQNVPAR